jgi:Nif-specific regulatory protein
LLERLEPSVRADLHLRAAELLAPEDGVAPELIERLWLGGGDRTRTIETATAAAAHGTDPARAARQLTRALRLMGRGNAGRLELRLRQAAALAAANLPLAGARAYGAALALAPDEQARDDILGLQAELLARGGRHSRARAVAEELQQSRSGTAALARAARIVALDDACRGEHADAARRLEGQAALADDSQRAEVLLALGECRSAGGLPGAHDALNRARELFDQDGLGDRAFRCTLQLAVLARDTGHYDEAEELLARASRFSEQAAFRAPVVGALAANALARGDFAEAVARGLESEDLACHTGDDRTARGARRTRAVALVRCGRIDAAHTLLSGRASTDDPLESLRENLVLTEIAFAGGRPESPGFNPSALLEHARELGHVETTLWALTLEAQSSAHATTGRPVDKIVEEFDALVAREGSPAVPHHAVRIRLAQASLSFGERRFDDARERAAAAAETARQFGLHALEASAASLESEALRWSGELAGAERTREGGRQALDRAAARMDDPELRAGFTEVPVFARLRRPVDLSTSSSSRKLVALYDMIRALNSQHDPDHLLTAILDMALDVVGAERGMILLRDAGAEFNVHLARNLEQATILDASAFSRRVLKQAGSGKAVLAVDAVSDERLRELKSVSMYGIHSVLCVPLRSRGSVVGAVYLDSRETGALFSEEDLEFLEAFAAHAALALQNAQAHRRLERENDRLRETAVSRAHFGNIVGDSTAMRQVFDLIRKVQPSELPVLIQGDSGTGKELVARAIHFNGPRSEQAFVTENCAALPESLLQSELFGHVKGAFTGAERDRVGLFEQADGGTLFMDEVGDMSPGMQAQLLRVLQEGEVRRVGGDRPIKVDVRVIAATNRDLQEEVRAGRFREDLLYRLEVLLIRLPALRDRDGDVALLIDHMLERISDDRGRPKPEIDVDLLELLESYSWPGNVRQLENVVQRLCLIAGDLPLTTASLALDPGLDGMLRTPLLDSAPALSLEVSERERIAQALDAARGNRSGAARMLGISRATIYRKIKEHGL